MPETLRNRISMDIRLGIQAIPLSESESSRRIRITTAVGDHRPAGEYIADVDNRRNGSEFYHAAAFRQLAGLLIPISTAWPRNLRAGHEAARLERTFSVWYDARHREIHMTAPGEKRFHLRFRNQPDSTAHHLRLYEYLQEILYSAHKLPVDAYV
jgi:hypothetical protein